MGNEDDHGITGKAGISTNNEDCKCIVIQATRTLATVPP